MHNSFEHQHYVQEQYGYTNASNGLHSYDGNPAYAHGSINQQSFDASAANTDANLTNQFSSLSVKQEREFGGQHQHQFYQNQIQFGNPTFSHQNIQPNQQYAGTHPGYVPQPPVDSTHQFQPQSNWTPNVYPSTANYERDFYQSYQTSHPPISQRPGEQTLHGPPMSNASEQAGNFAAPSPSRQQPLVPPLPPMPPSGIGSNYSQQKQQQPFTQGDDRNMGYPPVPPPPTGIQSDTTYPGRQYSTQAHPQYPNGPVARQPSFPQTMNTDGLPSAVEVMESNRNQCTGPFYTGQRAALPPLVTTEFISRDQGNCSPGFIRSSLYFVPNTGDLLKTVGIPFTLSISPFATQHPEDMNVVISDTGSEGPVRCVRCKAYINPFMNFIDGGRRFQCPLCNGLTEVPAHYFAHLDHTGRRVDCSQRPELCLGSYELTATQEYCKNNELPLPPAFIFLIDVSQTSVRSGLVQLFCSQFVERILPNLPREDYETDGRLNSVRVGFITYDHQLHFYCLSRESQGVNGIDGQNASYTYSKPQMHIVPDIGDVFVPAVEGFLLPPDPTAISSILEMIPTQFCSEASMYRHTPDAVLGPAIQSGLEALRAANRPGKLFVLHSNLPVAEAPGKLKHRDDRRLIGTEKEKTLLVPAGDFYTGLGQLCVELGCSVDLFLFPNAFVDMATLAEVPKLTAGRVYRYNCFQADLQGHQFLADLVHAVSSLKAFNAVMRVRTSTGIRPVEFYGNCYVPNTTDIELACVSSDSSIAVELRHDDKLQDSDIVFIQATCLYTSVSGQRRLRIHNLSLSVTSNITEVFRLVELDTHMNWLSKYAMRQLINRPHPQVLDDLTTRAANSLAAYRRHCTGGPGEMSSSPGELVLPQNMKLFPLYVQCLMKMEAFTPADGITIDDRCWQMFLINQMDVKHSNCYLYPHLYPVLDIHPNFEGNIAFPPAAIRCSYDRLRMDGAYLLDNGLYLILWIGSEVSPDWIQSVFKVPDPKHFESDKIYDIEALESENSRNLYSLFRKIREGRWHYSRLLVIRPGDKSEIWFRRFMVEDRSSSNSISYTEYLCHIHKEVSSLLR